MHGKGRKERDVPIWPATQREIHDWCWSNQVGPTQYLFANRHGASITRKGAALRLSVTLRSAVKICPSLRGRKITLHTFRHATAMHLLQSGVALPIIALWLGHEQPVTTHGYVEADLKMKEQCLNTLERLPGSKRPPKARSHLLAFLEAL
jgi:integrase